MNRFASLALILAVPLAACEIDNYPAPNAEITGRVVYQGEPVNVRQNAIDLELWQDGFELRREIPVNLHQDGTFAARVFDGVYKLNLKEGVGPWRDNPDTVQITLNGSESVDVPVEPYFIIEGESFTLNGNTLTAAFDVRRVVEGSVFERVGLYVGRTQFVDSRYHLIRAEQEGELDGDTGHFALTLDLADAFASHPQLFVRAAVKTAGVEEMLYTPVDTLERP